MSTFVHLMFRALSVLVHFVHDPQQIITPGDRLLFELCGRVGYLVSRHHFCFWNFHHLRIGFWFRFRLNIYRFEHAAGISFPMITFSFRPRR
jgi:hypothetical protein